MTPPRTFYLAASSADVQHALSLAAELLAMGLAWSYDWTPHLLAPARCYPDLAQQDLRGAVSADVFVLMAYPATMGGMLELGARLEHDRSRNKPLDCPRSTHVVLAPVDEDPRVLTSRTHFFFHHEGVTCVHASWAGFLDWIARRQEGL